MATTEQLGMLLVLLARVFLRLLSSSWWLLLEE